MRILHLSDTHNQHRCLRSLPEADVVVHSGDFCMFGSETEAIDFLNWFCDLSYSHKIFICGNHDECLYGADINGLDSNVHYLCNSSIEIDGIRFYGMPMFIRDSLNGNQKKNIEKIPADTKVLITHSPPYGILDFDEGINYGDKQLLIKVTEVQPRLHLFGHIHSQHGIISEHGIIFSNGAITNFDHTTISSFNELNI